MPQSDIVVKVKGLDEVLRALEAYKQVNNRKTFPEMCNEKTLDMTFNALAETERANKAEVKNLPLRSWWPKYIAKRLSGSGMTLSRKATKLEKFVSGNRKTKYEVKGHYTRQQARAASKQIIAARLRSVAFAASGWLAGIRELLKVVPRKERTQRRADAKQKGEPKGYGKPAKPGIGARISAVSGNTATSPKRGNTYRLVAVIERGAEKGVQATLSDMWVYMHRKMSEAARGISRDEGGFVVRDGARV